MDFIKCCKQSTEHSKDMGVAQVIHKVYSIFYNRLEQLWIWSLWGVLNSIENSEFLTASNCNDSGVETLIVCGSLKKSFHDLNTLRHYSQYVKTKTICKAPWKEAKFNFYVDKVINVIWLWKILRYCLFLKCYTYTYLQ